MAVLGLAALAGWLTGWPPQLFTAHKAGVAASQPGVTAPTQTVSVQAAPAAQQSSAAVSAPAVASAPGLTPSASASPTASDSGPAATVQAYFADINAHDYAAAWKLSEKVAGPSYANFAAGLDGTAEDTVTIVSVNGDQVTVQLVADQTDGTVKDYSGVYTVVDGSIVQAQVQQTN